MGGVVQEVAMVVLVRLANCCLQSIGCFRCCRRTSPVGIALHTLQRACFSFSPRTGTALQRARFSFSPGTHSSSSKCSSSSK